MNTIKPGVLTIRTYNNFAPVCGLRDDGTTLWGADITFIEKFAKAVGLTPEFRVAAKFEGIWCLPDAGDCDLAAAGISPIATRKCGGKEVLWSAHYFSVQRSLLIREEDRDRYKTIQDFHTETIGVTPDSTADSDTLERKNQETKVRGYNDQAGAIRDLKDTREIAAFGEGDVSNHYLAKKYDGLVLTDVHPLPGGEDFALAVRAESGILDVLNAWIESHKSEYTDIPELQP